MSFRYCFVITVFLLEKGRAVSFAYALRKQRLDADLICIITEEVLAEWGVKTGSRVCHEERNREIREGFFGGASEEELEERFGLAKNTIQKIIYG